MTSISKVVGLGLRVRFDGVIFQLGSISKFFMFNVDAAVHHVSVCPYPSRLIVGISVVVCSGPTLTMADLTQAVTNLVLCQHLT